VRSLFDVNVLLALMDREHVHRPAVRAWWSAQRSDGWASSPITQNGFVRIISQSSYPRPRLIVDAISILTRATARDEHQFWPDDLSILDANSIDHTRLLGPRQITGIYLLALAVKHGGRLVTLDTAISVAAVRGAEPRHLVQLLPN